jgi:hypothetical protein
MLTAMFAQHQQHLERLWGQGNRLSGVGQHPLGGIDPERAKLVCSRNSHAINTRMVAKPNFLENLKLF